MGRFRVSLGNDFDIEAVDLGPEIDVEAVLRGKTEQDVARARNKLAFLVLAGTAVALVSAGAMRIVEGNFNSLHAVWDVITVPLGMVLGFYFTRKD